MIKYICSEQSELAERANHVCMNELFSIVLAIRRIRCTDEMRSILEVALLR